MPIENSRKTDKVSPAKSNGKPESGLSRKNGKIHKQVKKLFNDIENLTSLEPADCEHKPLKREGHNPTVKETYLPAAISDDLQTQRELENLRARVLELEATLDSIGKTASAPMLYEKEQVGYAYKDDILEPLNITAWKPGTEAKNAIRVPFTSTGKTIGSLIAEATPERQWESEEENLLNTVAQQASLQIQNLRLLEGAERARTEAEAATRQFMHEGWSSYLDAIHQKERIGYAYDQASVIPFLDNTDTNGHYRENVTVMDEQVGTLALKSDPSRPLTDDDRKMVAAVANQVAQQVENIRLLADASRARAEAEDATRRMTREGWQGFTESRKSETLGFIYDTVEVSPFNGSTQLKNVSLTVPLEIRGETVGQLSIASNDKYAPEQLDLAAAIAAQISTHLETLRLTEELQQRAEELLELDHLKSGFLANMSHELRTPLNSIIGFADVMLMELDGPLTQNMNHDLKLIQKNGQHLLHLINDVLDMAKIESGRMNLNPTKFNVHEVLEEVNSITSTLASDRNLSLFTDQEVEIFADNTRVLQVMINLVNNAIKFTESGKIAIRASKQDSSTLLIAVKDTGIGIPMEKLDDIFQEFTQVDTSTTRKVGGTGLGLPISRRLIEMHGGRLWAESTGVPGEGSTFFVELPVEARITEVIEKREK